MKRLIFLSLSLFSIAFSFGQSVPTEPDKSPMDMSYCPNAYPVLKFQNKESQPKPNARIIYSRPQKKGREIFGAEVVKYNEVWRLGANESTEIDFFKNATIGGKKIAKGTYSIFCIPTANSWTIILNTDTDSWGSFSYDASKDVLRTEIPTQKTDAPVEYFTMYFDNSNNLIVMWDDVKISLPIEFATK